MIIELQLDISPLYSPLLCAACEDQMRQVCLIRDNFLKVAQHWKKLLAKFKAGQQPAGMETVFKMELVEEAEDNKFGLKHMTDASVSKHAQSGSDKKDEPGVMDAGHPEEEDEDEDTGRDDDYAPSVCSDSEDDIALGQLKLSKDIVFLFLVSFIVLKITSVRLLPRSD